MSRRAIHWIVVLGFFAAVVAGAVWHFLRPMETVSVIVAHVRIDPALNGGELHLGDRAIGTEAWIALTGDRREGRDLTTGEIDWYAVEPRTIAYDLLPGGQLDEPGGSPGELHEFLMLGSARVRGLEGSATVEGERHRWVWLVAGDPEQEHPPSGVALRARLGTMDLVVREATADLGERTRAVSPWQRWLLRRVVHERIVEITFAAPDRRPAPGDGTGER